jgi:class 3 adenylate cyclase/TolB-like protein
MERKLTAMLAADVAGYSLLMERDEAGTFARLRTHRKELFEPEIDKHHGHIFKLMGDGLLAEFGSVVDAVECAVLLQREMAERNYGLPDDQRIDVRIGLHLGDVIVEGEDRHGDAVNIVARLQQIADPGGICVSRPVVENVKHKVALQFEPRGEERLKNIAEPVAIYRLDIEVSPTGSTARRLGRVWQAAAAVLLLLAIGTGAGWYIYGGMTDKPSPVASTVDSAIGIPLVLVLPFQNLTGDPTQDNLGMGITEDLRDMLWNFPEFQVVSGTSSVATGNEPIDIKDLAQKLGVRFVIEGAVRRTGDKTVVTAQLIDGATDTRLWSTRFEEVSSDPVALEKAAADTLSSSLLGMTGKMREAYERIAWSKADSDLTEFDYYVRGHTHHMRFANDEMTRARAIYTAGLERFPDSALLRIKVAWADVYFAGYTWASPDGAEMARVRPLVSEAREMLAARRKSRFEEYYLHWISAYIYQIDRDFAHCVVEAKAAVALTPYDAWVRGTLAGNLAECGGSVDEAIEWAKESILRQPEGPPHDPENYSRLLAWTFYLADKCPEATAVIKDMKDEPLMTLAVCQVRLGMPEAARSTMAAYAKNNPEWTVKNAAAYPMIDPLKRRWLEDIRAAGLPER